MALPSVTITVRASKPQVLTLLRTLPAVLAGKHPVPATQKLMTRLGLTLQGLVSDAFITKSLGFADNSGLRWKPLAEATIRKKKRTAPANAYRILQEFNDLRDSLRPMSTPEQATQIPPSKPLQVFRQEPGRVIIGTSRPHARENHEGILGKLPQRRLWPEPRNWPSFWWQRLLRQAQLGTIQVIVETLKGRV